MFNRSMLPLFAAARAVAAPCRFLPTSLTRK
ncbi:hypothetical protein EYZ11_013135 [Aspergillus tanneri]|uniref:Uncharacterized protein n=1 Tax=Aspergillus tanneri TaxID=1220188 RepID=A0A4S3IYG0_9EURO|nr:hypothetical protein EYZ11_013135 [Aspergillus tanneri]